MKPTWTKRYVDRPGYPRDPAIMEVVQSPVYSCEFELHVHTLESVTQYVSLDDLPPSTKREIQHMYRNGIT